MVDCLAFVVFDFDVVLADTEVMWRSVIADELSALIGTSDIEELIQGQAGRVLADSIPIFEAEIGIRIPAGWAT